MKLFFIIVNFIERKLKIFKNKGRNDIISQLKLQINRASIIYDNSIYGSRIGKTIVR